MKILPYIGPKVRFGKTPKAASYIEVSSTQNSFFVSFGKDYPFVRGRQYRITLKASFLDAVTDVHSIANRNVDQFVPVEGKVTSKPALWRFNPRHGGFNGRALMPRRANKKPQPLGLKFKQCSAKQQQASHEGWAEAGRQIEAGALSYNSSSNGGPLFGTWFGVGTYKSHVGAVLGQVFNWITVYNNATVDCKGRECEDDVYAYVFPTDKTQTIYLCGAYWASPVYEQGNTFTHEVSHFRYIGDTDDFVYGQSGCKVKDFFLKFIYFF